MAKFYDGMCRTYAHSWQAAHWSSHESQQGHFAILARLARLGPDDRILDVGCGQGDLLGYLRDAGMSAHYTGTDVSPEMIARAGERFPGGRFLVGDFLADSFAEPFDWVLAAGTFNHRVEGEDQEAYLRRALGKMYELARRGAGALLLSGYDPHRRAESYLYGYDPATVLRLALELTPHVTLDHAAMPSSFAVFLYR